MKLVCDDEEDFYPLTTRGIIEAQQHDQDLKKNAEMEDNSTQLVKNIKVLCKDGKHAILKCLQHLVVA